MAMKTKGKKITPLISFAHMRRLCSCVTFRKLPTFFCLCLSSSRLHGDGGKSVHIQSVATFNPLIELPGRSRERWINSPLFFCKHWLCWSWGARSRGSSCHDGTRCVGCEYKLGCLYWSPSLYKWIFRLFSEFTRSHVWCFTVSQVRELRRFLRVPVITFFSVYMGTVKTTLDCISRSK